MTLTQVQLLALRSIAAGQSDCETVATRTTRTLRSLGLVAFGDVNGRVAYVVTDQGKAELENAPRSGKHRWTANNGDTCSACGLHREGAGAGPYGAMRYYRDTDSGYTYKPGACPGKISEPKA